MAQSIITSGNLLLSLLNDILDLSKIEPGRMEIVPGPVQLKLLLEEIRTGFGLQADQKGIALQMSVDDKLPEVVLIDEVRIKQVVFNLLGNAIKFTNKGEVQMTVRYTSPAGAYYSLKYQIPVSASPWKNRNVSLNPSYRPPAWPAAVMAVPDSVCRSANDWWNRCMVHWWCEAG